MRKITLICSGHRESGLCNADELLKILRAIEPEVIFAEVRPSDHLAVEFQAMAKYREFRSFHAVSVDKYDMPVHQAIEIKRHLSTVFDYVARVSPEYQRLNYENNKGVYEHGFKHLNAAACTTILARMSEIEEKAIAESGDRDLTRGLELWNSANQHREIGMVGSIYNYCRANSFAVGVFLVGAAHKTGIVREIKKHSGTDADLINWDLAYDGNPV